MSAALPSATGTSKKFLYLDEIIQEGKPIWVRNVHTPRGILVLQMLDAGGRPHREVIPNTKHPICLSNRATPQMIRDSQQLRTLLAKGVVQLVDPAEAEKEWANPNVAKAVEAAYAKIGTNNREINKMRETGTADDALMHVLPGGAVVASGDSGDSPKDKTPSDPNVIEDDFEEEEDAGVQARVKIIVDALGTNEMKARDAKQELDTLDLTETDLSFLIDKTSGMIQTYAKKLMAERTGQKIEIDEPKEE